MKTVTTISLTINVVFLIIGFALCNGVGITYQTNPDEVFAGYSQEEIAAAGELAGRL